MVWLSNILASRRRLLNSIVADATWERLRAHRGLKTTANFKAPLTRREDAGYFDGCKNSVSTSPALQTKLSLRGIQSTFMSERFSMNLEEEKRGGISAVLKSHFKIAATSSRNLPPA